MPVKMVMRESEMRDAYFYQPNVVKMNSSTINTKL